MRTGGAWPVAALIGAAILVGSCGFASALEDGGVVAGVTPFAAASGATGDRTLAVNGPVYMGDVIRTGANGTAQILLRDNTRLVVGPNSYMTVDRFVFSGNTAEAINLNAVRGAFRFITGLSPKKVYAIKTPSATIGVRGTRFDFSIDRRGRVALALYEGAAQLCNRRGQCTVVSGTCSIALAQRFGPMQAPTPDERRNLRANAFPFLDKQSGLNKAFRVDTSGCGVKPAGFLRLQDPGSSSGTGSAGSFGPGGAAAGGTTGSTGSTGGNSNRSGLADGTNPGAGSANNNAGGGGTNNPGGGGNGH